MTDDGGRAERIAGLGYDPSARDKEPVRACNLCGSEHLAELARRDRYGYPTTFLLCPRCGLGFISPRLTAAEYGHFYESVYRPLVSAYHGRTIDAATVQDEQREYAHDLAGFLAPRLGAEPRTIMDVGGSTGVVGGALGESFGAAVTVLDPSPDELAVAQESGYETVAGFAEDFDPGGRTWDLVLLCQTIDHLLDVSATLRALAGMVAPGGHAFVDVLDVSFMMRRRGSIEGAVKIDHPCYLTRGTALAYFGQAGLAVVSERLSGDGHWGFLLTPGEATEPDWNALGAEAARLVDQIANLRAAGG